MTPKEEQKHTVQYEVCTSCREKFLTAFGPDKCISCYATRKADCHEEYAAKVIRQAIHEGFYNNDAGRDEMAKKAAATIFARATNHQAQPDLIREQFKGEVNIPTREKMGLLPLSEKPQAMPEREQVDCECGRGAAKYKVQWPHGAESLGCDGCMEEYESNAREIDAHEDMLASNGHPFSGAHCPRPSLVALSHPQSDEAIECVRALQAERDLYRDWITEMAAMSTQLIYRKKAGALLEAGDALANRVLEGK